MKILKGLERSKEFWLVIVALLLFFVLRFPSLFEPLWYGDEGIYQAIGISLDKGKLLYTEAFDNKPPLLYWTYSFFNSDQFMLRLASLIAGALSVMFFFFLSKDLFKNNKNNIHIIATFIFAILFGLPLLEGNIANAENFMLLPIISAAYLVFANIQHTKSKLIINHLLLIISGILLGIAFLFKIVAIFDLAAFIIFYFTINFKSLKKEIKKILSIIYGFFLPILMASIFFLTNGTFLEFIRAAFITNVSYISYGNKIGDFPLLIFVKLIILGIVLLYLFIKRKKHTATFIFIIIWLAFSMFNAFFSQRPYTHYLLVLLPSLSLTIGLVLFDKKNQKIIGILLLIAAIVIFKNFNVSNYKKNVLYYQNFINYMRGEKTTVSYQSFFDRNTPIDYEIARYIKPKLGKNDTIFVWGNNAQLYKLVNATPPTKYVVAYHIANYKDGLIKTKSSIEKIKPKFIIVMPNTQPIPFSLVGYFIKISIDKVAIYERTF
ncbi:MAG: glycosyltransferase family 39 protein [Candidatus Levybacteria bacterium]|nr:glycosyltransferase family 39 protein [Candidatus Levybacteria bacterium]